MNFNLTENQKRILTAAATALMMLLALFLGYNVEKPAAVVTPAPEVEFGAAAISSGIKCGASADPCVIGNWGRDIVLYSDEGTTQKFSVDGATGLITSAGIKCVKGSQSVVAGSATVIPATLTAAGITTPTWSRAQIAVALTGDADKASTTNSAGVITLLLYNSALTPAASTTTTAANYEVCGSN